MLWKKPQNTCCAADRNASMRRERGKAKRGVCVRLHESIKNAIYTQCRAFPHTFVGARTTNLVTPFQTISFFSWWTQKTYRNYLKKVEKEVQQLRRFPLFNLWMRHESENCLSSTTSFFPFIFWWRAQGATFRICIHSKKKESKNLRTQHWKWKEALIQSAIVRVQGCACAHARQRDRSIFNVLALPQGTILS